MLVGGFIQPVWPRPVRYNFISTKRFLQLKSSCTYAGLCISARQALASVGSAHAGFVRAQTVLYPVVIYKTGHEEGKE